MPDIQSGSPLARFTAELQDLRARCGNPKLTDLERLSKATVPEGSGLLPGERVTLSKSTLSQKLRGDMPKAEWVSEFVRTCSLYAREHGIMVPAERVSDGYWSERYWQLCHEIDASEPDRALRAAARKYLASRNDAVTSSGRVRASLVPQQLPPATAYFAGRAAALDRLDALAEQPAEHGAIIISAINGTAGVGKTALAIFWAQREAHRFPDGQLYLNLRGFEPGEGPPLDPADALYELLEGLGIPATDIPASLSARSARFRSEIAGTRRIIVLDNARDATQVRPLLPGSPTTLTLITSRDRLQSLAARGEAEPLPLLLMERDEAYELLVRRLGAARLEAEPAATERIIERCSRLPLALALVAARAAASPRLTLTDIADQLEQTADTLAAFTSHDPAADLRTVLTWSYDKLTPRTARLFRMLSLHTGPDIGVGAAASLAGVTLAEAERQLRELHEANLLEETAPNRFTRHDILATFALELIKAHDDLASRHAARGRLVDHYLHSAHRGAAYMFPLAGVVAVEPVKPDVVIAQIDDYATAWRWYRLERPNLMAVLNLAYAEQHFSEAWRLACCFEDYFKRSGHWGDWVSSQTIALAAAEVGNDLHGVAHCRHSRGRANTWLERYSEAESDLQAAIEAFASLGDKAGQAHAELDLAQMLSYDGRARDAIPYAQHGYELAVTLRDRGIEAKALNNGGYYHALVNEPHEALERCTRALAIFQDLGNERGQSNTLDSIGYAHSLLGDHRNAIRFYEQALPLRRKLGDRPDEAATLEHIGDSWLLLDNPSAARLAYQQALDILHELQHTDAENLRRKLRQIGD